MSWWNFWRKSKPDVATDQILEDELPDVPTITVEGLMDGSVYVKIKWPEPVDRQHGAAIARELANMLYLLSVGDLFSTMIQAIAIQGNQIGDNSLANAVIDVAQRAMATRAGHDRDSKLVIAPEEVFKTSARD